MNSMSGHLNRHVVFCGEVGTGKSSVINLLLRTGALANVSNGVQPCTQVSAKYETTLDGTRYNLWDTRGLSEGRKSLRDIFRRSSDKELKKFLKLRCQKNELDLLVYCVRVSRVTEASEKYYHSFCAITRRLVAPIVIVVTHLEKEKNMEDWWGRNTSRLADFKMEFDGHVCITALAGHHRLVESRMRLTNLITKDYRWRAKEDGSYFGIPVQKLISSAPPSKGGIASLFKHRSNSGVGNGSLDRQLNNDSRPSSRRNSSFVTAPESPRGSVPPTPITECPTRRAFTPARAPHIEMDLSKARDLSPSTSEEGSSLQSSSFSHISVPSSYTSNSHLQPWTEENEDHTSGLPFEYPPSAVRKRQGYPSQYGGFGSIWECELISDGLPRKVAVKAVKVDDKEAKGLMSHGKKLHRELKIWGRLQHRNIVPLLGVVDGFGPLPSMISPWFSNGSLSRYLKHHQTLDLMEKHQLLRDIATGLSYLHREDVIHGDLHSDNVLIDDDGTACLTDFGLSLIKDFVGTSYVNSSICGSIQFADPALVKCVHNSQGNLFYPTKPCDVYSFGGLMLHVLSGKKPYANSELPNSAAIYLRVLSNERPQLPTGNSDITQWHESLIQRCWDHEEPNRPSADDLLMEFS